MPTPKNQTRDTHSAADTPGEALDEALLDEALKETFPASDPIAVAPKRGGKADKRIAHTVPPDTSEPDTTDAKTPSNMKTFHNTFERRRR